MLEFNDGWTRLGSYLSLLTPCLSFRGIDPISPCGGEGTSRLKGTLGKDNDILFVINQSLIEWR